MPTAAICAETGLSPVQVINGLSRIGKRRAPNVVRGAVRAKLKALTVEDISRMNNEQLAAAVECSPAYAKELRASIRGEQRRPFRLRKLSTLLEIAITEPDRLEPDEVMRVRDACAKILRLTDHA